MMSGPSLSSLPCINLVLFETIVNSVYSCTLNKSLNIPLTILTDNTIGKKILLIGDSHIKRVKRLNNVNSK